MSLGVSPAEIVARAEASGRPGLLDRAPHWERVRLGDIANVVNGAAFSSRYFNPVGQGLPLIRIRDVGAPAPSTWYSGKWEPRYLVNRGDILIGMDGDFRVARWRGDQALLNQRVCKINVHSSEYDDRFLVLVLQGYLDAIWAETSSVTVKHLSSRTVSDIPLPWPTLAEQRCIVEVLEDHLSRLDAADAGLSTSFRRLGTLRDQTIRAALTGGDRNDRAHHTLTDVGTVDGALPMLPTGWEWARLGEVADVVGGVTKDAKKQSDPRYVEVPYLRVANVQRGHLKLDDVTTIRVDPAKAEALRLLPGDVLLNEGGDRDKLARGWVWEGQVENCIHQNHVFRARVTEPRLDPYFLSWTANTFGGPWAERNGKQSVNLASISLTRMRQMPVIVPAPGEAADVVARLHERLDSIRRLDTSITHALDRAQSLRRSLLTAAFSGRLTKATCDIELAV